MITVEPPPLPPPRGRGTAVRVPPSSDGCRRTASRCAAVVGVLVPAVSAAVEPGVGRRVACRVASLPTPLSGCGDRTGFCAALVVLELGRRAALLLVSPLLAAGASATGAA
jgi:hypothetical protein